MAQQRQQSTYDEPRCRELLATQSLGRVGWNSAAGVQILPVSYGLVGDVIVFRTRDGSPLAELVRPVEVSFQVDDLDDANATGWSVLVHGRSGASVEALPDNLPESWASLGRTTVIGIAPDHYAGRFDSH